MEEPDIGLIPMNDILSLQFNTFKDCFVDKDRSDLFDIAT